MEHYEILLLIDGRFSDEEAETPAKKLAKRITDLGGRVTREEHLGKRKLAYPIAHQKQGHYYLLEFETEASKIDELERELRLEQDILRHQVVRRIIRNPEVVAAERELQERLRVRRLTESQTKTEAEIKEPAEPAPVPATPAERQASLEKLDEKLDEILSKDIIE